METPPQYWLLVSALYLLGTIGFFGITLLPLRAWLLLRANLPLLSAPALGKVAYFLVMLAAIVAVGLSAASLAKVAKCLLGLHCHANRSGGWFFLVSIGVWYLAFEAFAFAVFQTVRRLIRVAT